MRDNLVVSNAPNSFTPEPKPFQPATVGDVPAMVLTYQDNDIGMTRSLLISAGVHIGSILLIWLFLILLEFFGIHLLTFDRPQPVQDIEFQLVNAPEEAPRNPKTRNRAEHNTRAGGEKIPNMREAQTQRQAGNPQPRQRPQPSVSATPTPRSRSAPNQTPQPQRPQQQAKPVAQQPSQQPDNTPPAPPRPRVTAPRPTTDRQRISAVPNPVAPIQVPESAGPVTTTGPLVRGPASGSGTAGSGSGGGGASSPATVPGQFSGGGRPSSAGSSGQGGRSPYSQYGSPGGGGGRPGVDAIAEPDFGPYLAELQRRIRRNWTPPDDREDKSVVLLFSISRDGRLLSVNVKRSSGFANADAAARAAVERSAPFRPLPPEYRNNSISVEFTFDYNVYMGRSGGISRH